MRGIAAARRPSLLPRVGQVPGGPHGLAGARHLVNLQLLKATLPLALLVILGGCGGGTETSDGSDPDGTSNSAPVIVGTPATKAVAGVNYEFVPEAADADEDVLTFAIENRPDWATFSPTTGRLSGRPPASAAAHVYADILISVSDSKAVAELPAYDLEVENDPDFADVLEIPGTCTKLTSELPQRMWETAATFDPETGELVHHGGHVTYAQSSYTYLYHPDNGTIRRAKPRRTPPRVCLQDGTYAESRKVSVFAHGRSAHGSVPPGEFKDGIYTALRTADETGPWLYDSAKDDFEYARTVGDRFTSYQHAPMAYDASSDVVYSLSETELFIYSVQLNKVFRRALPIELHRRRNYGAAVDPNHRTLVIFGGVSPTQWQYLKSDLGLPDSEFQNHVKKDTWTYRLEDNTWEKLPQTLQPPRGFPGSDFIKYMMVYEPRNGNILLRVTPIEDVVYDRGQWPRAETWAFNTYARQWKKLILDGEPRFPSLTTYDSENHRLVIMGGGDDVVRKYSEGVPANLQPASSRELFVCELPTQPDALSTNYPKRITVYTRTTTTTDPTTGISKTEYSNQLEWTAQAGQNYTIYRAEANPLPGTFQEIGAVTADTYVDRTALSTEVYAYRVSPTQSVVKNRVYSNVAFDQPRRPAGLTASVEGANLVKLRWDEAIEPDVAGYNVYRAWGSDIRTEGAGKNINTTLINGPAYIDASVDLSDLVSRFYWVTAVNRAGKESGPSPYAMTFPDAPLAVNIDRHETLSAPTNEIRIWWEWPSDMAVSGFNVYFVDNHMNTHDKPAEVVNAWYASWAKANSAPILKLSTKTAAPGHRSYEYTFTIPSNSTAPHYYFYVRAVNVLGQEGQKTDIISKTSDAFGPHINGQWGGSSQ